MAETTIEWADGTANAASGCTEARYEDGTMRPECVRCYARLQTARMPDLMRGGKPSDRKEQIAQLYEGAAERTGRGAKWTGILRWDPALLGAALDGLRTGRTTFLGSMTDHWHPSQDPAYLVALAAGIRRRNASLRPPPRGLILLTKRGARQLAWQQERFPEGLPPWVWPGITAGTQRAWDEQGGYLRQVNAWVRVVSAEPLLSALDPGTDSGIGWLIAGCESGEGRRASDPGWFRGLRDWSRANGVPFFLKQMDVAGSVVGTPQLDKRTHDEVPQ